MSFDINGALQSALIASVIGTLLASAVKIVPPLAAKLAAQVNAFEANQKNVAVHEALHLAVAYFKAHESDFASKGVTLVDYAIGRVSPLVPGLDKTEVEHIVQAFVAGFAADLK